MSERGEKVPPRRQASEYLANERTFLAWVRTSITIISFGFIVAKFNVWLHEIVGNAAPRSNLRLASSSLPIGVAMMAVGAILAVLAAWRYNVTVSNIERGRIKADKGLIILVTALIVVLVAATIIYVFLSTGG